jgi:ribosomal-protein-alanine N-acetyltransferase
LVAEDVEMGVVGYAVVWWVMDQGELANLAVAEGLRGRGIGSVLLDRVLADVRERGVETLFLEVRVSNDSAFRLYLSRGFIQVAVRKDYYRRPREDARILLKDLKD